MVDMLTACETILLSAIANKTFLISKKSKWGGTFFEDLSEVVKNAFSSILGIDNMAEQRSASKNVRETQAKAIRDLSEFKSELNSEYRKDKVRLEELLQILGYNGYHRGAQKGDQEDLVDLLSHFKENMTDELKTELTDKGIEVPIIDSILELADLMRDYNAEQEQAKGHTKEITDEGIAALNDIYDDVMSISTLAYNYFRDEPAKQELFSFARVVEKMNKAKAKAEENEEENEGDNNEEVGD